MCDECMKCDKYECIIKLKMVQFFAYPGDLRI